MSKNIFDYIFMGFRKKKSIKNREIEAEEAKVKADKFDKAFTDKTYSVAKKVLDNVEKVADFNYDALFDRVNKAIDDKLPKTSRTITSEERKNRSEEFDSKVASHPNRFNIDDYIKKEQNYKDSIIEKTKKNIQKKYVEADKRQKVDSEDDNKLPDLENTAEIIADSNIGETTNESTQEELVITDVDATPIEAINSKEIKGVEVSHKITQQESIDVSENEIPLSDDSVILDTEVTEALSVEAHAELDEKSEPLSTTVELKDIVELKDKVEEKDLNQTDTSISDQMSDPNTMHVSMDEDKSYDMMDDSVELVSDSVDSIINQSIEPEVSDYTKTDLKKSSTYYKKRKKDKFAKRMKVELEDSIIGQQKRSFKRLFKFSLSFKLSFVFMILIILTVVSLSVAFYLGIDYVIQLREMGKLEDIQFFKDVLLVLLIIFDMAAILICVSLGTKASRELVRPIDEMTLIVKQINANDMDRRLNVKGMHDELKELAMTFNEMLDRIENSYETQNRFTSDASHELRTPIAVIQGYINMLDRWGKGDGEILDESIEAIKSESHNMKRLTEKLLLLAKADKGILELDFQSFELNHLINEISRETQMIDTNHTIVNNINDAKLIYADRESLKQAIRIFVDNAVKYTPEGGTIALNSYINKKKIYIEIEDNGIGISKEDMDNIFNRFYRVDKSRSKDSGGHGLGLSIAKWIISQHKGEIEVKSELEKGTVITLVLSPMKE